MYERSVIVLERYTEEILGLNKSSNLKNNFYTYKEMVEEEKVYKAMLEEEEEILQKFDEIAKEVQQLQKKQDELYRNNKRLEEERNSLFYNFDTSPEVIDKKLIRLEEQVDKNNEELKDLRKKYVEALSVFIQRQHERNICARKKKEIDKIHLETIEKTRKMFEMISRDDAKRAKDFVNKDKKEIKSKIIEIMMQNGKNEKVPFDKQAVEIAVDVRIDIAVREAQCYVLIYDRLRRLLVEVDNDNIMLARYEKALRDVTVKLNFLNSEKEYIVGFLDNERMAAMNGVQIHKKMMKESCDNFDEDIKQIDNLYELIVKEVTNKSTKKAYNELYNNTYLKEIEEKEKDFEQEITNVRMRTGAVINSNYWRIESIKNIYTVFSTEVTEKFGKDLSAYNSVIEETKQEEKKEDDYIENLYEGIETDNISNISNKKVVIQKNSLREKKEESVYDELDLGGIDDEYDDFDDDFNDYIDNNSNDNEVEDDDEVLEIEDDYIIEDDEPDYYTSLETNNPFEDNYGEENSDENYDDYSYDFEDYEEEKEDDEEDDVYESYDDDFFGNTSNYGKTYEHQEKEPSLPARASTGRRKTLRIKKESSNNTINRQRNNSIKIDDNKSEKINKIKDVESEKKFNKKKDKNRKKKERKAKKKINDNFMDEVDPFKSEFMNSNDSGFDGIADITPKNKKKNSGFFNKILKANKEVKNAN